MKKKGFTLIELIVVIAIVGILAAILVPAMIGYVTKSKIMSANTAAKQIQNALNTSLVELDAMDYPVTVLTGNVTTTGSTIYACKDLAVPITPPATTAEIQKVLYTKVSSYFSDIQKIDDLSYQISGMGCQGVGVIKGRYPGTSPMAIRIEDYKRYVQVNSSLWNAEDACDFAMGDLRI